MLTKRTLLIVDDMEVNRNILVKILSEEYNTVEARNGEQALQILKNNPEVFSAILLDVVMPVMDGYEFLKIQQQIPFLSSIPIIVTTEKSGGVELEIEALANGASDFLTKPYHPAVIKHRIANIIKLRETAAFINTIEHDSLTGLYRKEVFYNRAAELLANSTDTVFDMVCTDIDNFKLINEMLGEKKGDSLLCYMASLMNELAIEKNGMVCRISSDVFALLLPHQPNNTLLERLYKTANNYPLNFQVTIRVGVYTINDLTLSISTMCDRARLAIKSIKGKYEQYLAVYDKSLQNIILKNQEIESSMQQALANGEFKVYLQPKCFLDNGKIIGAEALVRWDRGERGVLPPADFIPIFEKNGFIADLDVYIWNVVCQTMRRWMDRGLPPFPISVNVSRVDLYTQKLPDVLEEITHTYSIPNELLYLEITETAYMENVDQLCNVITELKRRNFYVEMDDFGSGYSSLNMLCNVPVDILKLDMRFLQTQNEVSKAGNIISFILNLAEWLRLPVIAEGIETENDVKFLKGIGCKFGQGYFYAKPMPIPEFEKLLTPENIYEVKPHDLYRDTRSSLDLKMTSECLECVLPYTQDVIFEWDAVTHEVLVSDTFYGKFGYSAVDKRYFRGENIHPSDRDLLRNTFTKLLEGVAFASCEIRMLGSGNEYIWCKISMASINSIDGTLQKTVGIISDISDQKRLLELVQNRANCDPLTGVYNRTYLEDVVAKYLAQEHHSGYAFIMLDLDNFKEANDSLGHASGDTILRITARRLRSIFRPSDCIARMGGDEFAIFMSDVANMGVLTKKLDSMVDKIGAEITIARAKYVQTISIGACYVDINDKLQLKQCYKIADEALYEAKNSGKNA